MGWDGMGLALLVLLTIGCIGAEDGKYFVVICRHVLAFAIAASASGVFDKSSGDAGMRERNRMIRALSKAHTVSNIWGQQTHIFKLQIDNASRQQGLFL